MGAKSSIEWTDSSWTPIRARCWEIQSDGSGKERIGWHCEHVSEGCRNCYAEKINLRLGTGFDFKPGNLRGRPGYHGGGNDRPELFLDEKMLLAPLRWKKSRMIFVCSMTDAFADFVKDEWLDKIFAVMALCPQHTFQVLTKRAERMRAYLSAARAHPVGLEALGLSLDAHARDAKSTVGTGVILQGDIAHLKAWPLPNVWLGISAERQQEADERIPLLLQTPAAVRFISAEPLLGPIDLSAIEAPDKVEGDYREHKIDWVISGGESGPKARPSHIEWFRSLREQCAAAGVAYFHKQNGEWLCGTQFTAEHRDRDPNPEQSKHPCMNWDGKEFYQSGGAWCDDLDENAVFRVGKKSAGRHLDGRTHDEMPE